MPVPIVGILVIAGAGAIGLGGYEAGKQFGEAAGKSVPWLAGSFLAYLAYQAAVKR